MTFIRPASLLFLLAVSAAAGCAIRPAVEGASAPRRARVLILGDSISIGYTPHVRVLLADRVDVVRPMAKDGKKAENCAGTTYGKDQIGRWLDMDGGGFDVVHFNFGLHDLKRVDPVTGRPSRDVGHPRQADLAVYLVQLREITSRLQASGARLIYATTTPVPEGGVSPHRDPEDVVRYNVGAEDLMKELGIAVNDLYAFSLPRLDEIQVPANVHFTKEGSEVLAGKVGEAIRERLAADSLP